MSNFFKKVVSISSMISQHLWQQTLSIIPYNSRAGCNSQGKSLISDSFRIF